MLGTTHQTPEATWIVAKDTQLFDSDYSVLSRGVLALEQFHCSCWYSSQTTLSLFMKGSSDMCGIPFDKLRPVGNKATVVATELWHTAKNQVHGLSGDLTLKSISSNHSACRSFHFIHALPPSSPQIRILVSQGVDISTLPRNMRSRRQRWTCTRHYAKWPWQLIVNRGKLASEIMRMYSNYE